MLRRKEITGMLFFFFFLNSNAQEKEFKTDEQLWLGYFNQTKWHEHWGIWADAHIRFSDHFIGDVRQVLGRVGVSWLPSKNLRLTLGHAFVMQTSAESRNGYTENRPWQQLMWLTHHQKTKITQWLRFEQRFRRVEEGENTVEKFNFRCRFNSLIQIPVQKTEDPRYYWVFNDELFLNFGKEIVYNTFDQNRFFTGLAYHPSHSLVFQLGYMNIVQQRESGNKYDVIHCIRFFVFQNLNF